MTIIGPVGTSNAYEPSIIIVAAGGGGPPPVGNLIELETGTGTIELEGGSGSIELE